MQQLDLLILGAGWTSTFLIPLCQSRNISFAATTRDGRKVAGASTTPWSFNPDESATAEKNQFSQLPLAKNILITFPLTGKGQSKTVVEGYRRAQGNKADTARFVQFGSSGIWQIPQQTIWVSRRSPYNTESPRAIAEDELLGLGGAVLNLAGLWGGERQPKNWVGRVAKSKDDVKSKKSLHMVHGQDVARAVLAALKDWDKAKGQRWMVTDGFVYDWWALMAGWADVKAESEGVKDEEPSDQARWVLELMNEERVWALPRSMEALGRCYFGREFWDHFGLVPLKARI
ncbi:hypothetical protein B0A50_05290 [Salinomyces thailandicus]|uniref:Uncharacterized protein n=1 Tax=Salinomyces thailandicus TaxID=706561 RepID=A0A4U0TVZ4_9PEZI|nr:hypothetical protein B0A50_05290 [Salinomyces thailandica]